jgi:hypothetical protein
VPRVRLLVKGINKGRFYAICKPISLSPTTITVIQTLPPVFQCPSVPKKQSRRYQAPSPALITNIGTYLQRTVNLYYLPLQLLVRQTTALHLDERTRPGPTSLLSFETRGDRETHPSINLFPDTTTIYWQGRSLRTTIRQSHSHPNKSPEKITRYHPHGCSVTPLLQILPYRTLSGVSLRHS